MSDNAKGIIDTLKDLSFSEFITTKIIKLLYILGVILVTISSVGMIITGFMGGFVNGLISIVLAPIVFALGIIMIRVYLELVIVIFRIAEHTGKMAGESDPVPAKAEDKPAPEKKEKKEDKKEEEKKDDDKEEESKDE